MSEKLTRIRIPKEGEQGYWGFLDWGEKTREEMVNQARLRAKHLRAEADALDLTADDDFEIDIVIGRMIQRHVKKVP